MKTVNELLDEINSLYAQLNEKKLKRARGMMDMPAFRVETRSCVFLKGEILFFSNKTASEVMISMTNIGVPSDAFDIITSGFPLYFTNKADYDIERPPPYFLQHKDLPYGFSSDDGTFRFSSQEISKLTLASSPSIINDAYTFIGADANLVKYEDISNPSKIEQYCMMMNGLGWTPSNTKNGALVDVGSGNYANVTLRDGELLDRRYFIDEQVFRKEISSGSGYVDCHIINGIGKTNYTPGKYIGWRWVFSGRGVNTDTLTEPLIEMPEGQISDFEVNPQNREPYYGAEGVYPVIMVEMTRDVNVEV